MWGCRSPLDNNPLRKSSEQPHARALLRNEMNQSDAFLLNFFSFFFKFLTLLAVQTLKASLLPWNVSKRNKHASNVNLHNYVTLAELEQINMRKRSPGREFCNVAVHMRTHRTSARTWKRNWTQPALGYTFLFVVRCFVLVIARLEHVRVGHVCFSNLRMVLAISQAQVITHQPEKSSKSVFMRQQVHGISQNRYHKIQSFERYVCQQRQTPRKLLRELANLKRLKTAWHSKSTLYSSNQAVGRIFLNRRSYDDRARTFAVLAVVWHLIHLFTLPENL